MNKKEWEQKRTDYRHNRSARVAWIRALLIDRPLTENGFAYLVGWGREIVDLDYAYDQLMLIDVDNADHKAQSD